MQSRQNRAIRKGEEGFMLLGAIVLVFLVMLALSIAAPKVARNLQRDREVEAIHRGNEYVRAVQLYYRKFGRYPGTMDQLEKSTNIRFLRQKYTDPMTGKADWRLIHIGEAKTTVKGFFGQPLAGLPGAAGGLGAASSMVSSGPGGSTVSGTPSSGMTGGFGSSSPTGSSGSGSPSSGFSLGSSGSSGSGSSSSGFSLGSSSSSSSPGSSPMSGSPSSTPGNTVSSGSTDGTGSQSATSFSGGGAPIVGIGSSHSGSSITILNEQATYQTWEFIYDPRIEQMKANGAMLGGAASGGSGSPSGFGSSPGFGSPSSPTSPSPSSPGVGSPTGYGSGSSGSPSSTSPQ